MINKAHIKIGDVVYGSSDSVDIMYDENTNVYDKITNMSNTMAYIDIEDNENVEFEGTITGSTVELVDRLDSTSTTSALTANQGKVLKGYIDELNADVESCFQSVSDGKELIASAITDKNVPTDATDTFETMANNILNIVTESSDNTDVIELSGDATAANVLSGKTFYNTDPETKITGTMTDNGAVAKSITPSTSSQTYTIPAGYHDGNGKVTVNAAPTSLINGDATEANVLSGKTFFSDSYTAKTGTMTDNSGTIKSATGSLDSTNKRVQLTVPTNGYYNTSSKLYIAYSTLASLIGLTAAKLVKGNTVLGIAGTANTGEYTLKKIYGCSSAIKKCSLSNLTVGKSYLVIISSFSGQGWNTAQSKYAKISSYTGCTLTELFYTNDASNSASRFYKMVPSATSVTLTTAANETATYTVCE